MSSPKAYTFGILVVIAMVDISTLLQVLATAMALFIGLLPITYMSWRERFIEGVKWESKKIETLGNWMVSKNNNIVKFYGPFRVWKIDKKVNINEPPPSLQWIDEKLAKAKTFERGKNDVETNPEKAVQDGLSYVTNKTLARGKLYFITLMIIYALLLLLSTFVYTMPLSIPFQSPINLSHFIFLCLVFGTISYIIYAITMFSEPQINWEVPPTKLDSGDYTEGMVSSLWHHY